MCGRPASARSRASRLRSSPLAQGRPVRGCRQQRPGGPPAGGGPQQASRGPGQRNGPPPTPRRPARTRPAGVNPARAGMIRISHRQRDSNKYDRLATNSSATHWERELETLLDKFSEPPATRCFERLHFDVVVPPMRTNLGDPMDAREVLPVIQGNIEVKCSVGGPLVCPHPEKLSIHCIADLGAELPFHLTQAHHVAIDRPIVHVGPRFPRELAYHLIARHEIPPITRVRQYRTGQRKAKPGRASRRLSRTGPRHASRAEKQPDAPPAVDAEGAGNWFITPPSRSVARCVPLRTGSATVRTAG